MNTHGQHELELAENRVAPENQAELVPGPDPDKIENVIFFLQKIKSATLLVQDVKGQPDSSIYWGALMPIERFRFFSDRNSARYNINITQMEISMITLDRHRRPLSMSEKRGVFLWTPSNIGTHQHLSR